MIKIALIGSSSFCARVLSLTGTPHRADVSLSPYIYAEPLEARDIVKRLKPCDVILFSGSLPFDYAREAVEAMRLPYVVLRQDETAITATLLSLSLERQIGMDTVSIDIREQGPMEHILNDLGSAIRIPYIHYLTSAEAIDCVTGFHAKLFAEGKTQVAVTSVHAVHEQLRELQIPSMKMIDPESSILRTIEEAKQVVLLERSRSSQIAVGLIRTESPALVQNAAKQLAGLLHGHISPDEEGFNLFTTLGNIESAVATEPFHALFRDISEHASMAFGCGETTVEAAQNARQAIGLLAGPGKFYILDGAKRLRGPYPDEAHTINLQVNTPMMQEMAEQTKLSPANLSKVIQFGRFRQSKQFTANDLAVHMGVTRRTAERIIKKMTDFDYILITGEEMTYKQGRPSALYELNFPLS